MQQHVGAMGGQDGVELGRVADVADGHHRHLGCEAAELEPQLVEARLVDLDEHEPRRFHEHDLPAQLGADRARRAGDRHHAATQRLAHLPGVYAGGLTTKQVLHIDASQVTQAHGALGDDDLGHDAGLYVGIGRGVEHSSHGLGRSGRQRDDDLLDLVAFDRDGKLGGGAEHGNAADGAAVQRRVVVQEADHGQAEVRAIEDLAQQQRARASGAQDQDAPARTGPRRTHVQEHPRGEPDRGGPQEHQDDLDEQHADRHGAHQAFERREQVDGEQGGEPEHGGREQLDERVHAHVAQHQPVQPETCEEDPVEHGRRYHQRRHPSQELGRDHALEACVVGDRGGDHHDRRVQGDECRVPQAPGGADACEQCAGPHRAATSMTRVTAAIASSMSVSPIVGCTKKASVVSCAVAAPGRRSAGPSPARVKASSR